VASIGINVPGDGSASASLVRSLGATWVRLVALPDVDLTPALRAYRALGIRVLLVLARESGVDYAAYRDRYAGLVDALEVGNEPDLDSPSSWTMTQAELGALGRSARAIWPTATLVLGGLASGQPSWLDGVDLGWCDAVAVHPYLKDSTPGNDVPDVGELLDGYRAYGKPLVISEWGWWGDDEERGAVEVRDMARWAASTGDVELFCYFCLGDWMVPPFGLYRADGTAKPAADYFMGASARAIHSLWPTIVQPVPAPVQVPAPIKTPVEVIVPTPPAAPAPAVHQHVVGSGLVAMMKQDGADPSECSTFLPLGRNPAETEVCYGTNGTLYRWSLELNRGYRFPADPDDAAA
jgi:hypothetical protein